ncbi:hypothetical protein LSM04_007380 [Trypanosoma melophagium]|uniref:uncharacterized protein n=1 Tax=Trypanosoma melophagium TaxID=715481 RepID=UPI00351A54C9|nr:hypothetical protein LSM04_007380 [Trypanosoma melophagium]
MSGRKVLQSSAEKKKEESSTPQSVGGGGQMPSNSSLLQQLLLDLGFTDTAKTLVQETRRKLQLAASSSYSQTNVLNDGVNPSDHVSTNNHNRNGNNFSRKSNGVNGNVSTTNVVERDEIKEKEDVMLQKMKGMTLFRALAHQSGSSDNGINDSIGVLQLLCNMCISTISCNTDPSCSSYGKECLTPLLRKLFNVLLENQGDEGTDQVENNNGMNSLINLPPAWVSLMQVFFAYVEVLWSQLYLVEMVSCADFLFRGWNRYRCCILERLSQFQEKIQRLLLEAHQLERFTNNYEKSVLYCNKNNKTESATRNKGKNNSSPLPSRTSSVPFVSGKNGRLLTRTEINKSIIDMFCRGAPTFRRNLEEVSMWILDQCGRCVQGNNSANGNHSETRNTEPISPVKDTSGRCAGESKEGQEFSSQKLWHQCMGTVRHAVLVENENVTNQKEKEWESLPLVDPKLHWTLVVLRIQLLAWVVGSLAEFAELLHKELYPPNNDAEEKEDNNNNEEVEKNSRKQSNTGGNKVRQKNSLGGTVLGFWYHNCAAQITEKLGITIGKTSDSPALTPSRYTREGEEEKKETINRRLPRPHRAEVMKEQEEIGRSLVNILKSAVHDYFLGNYVSVEPFYLQLLNDKLLYDEAIGKSSRNNGSNGNALPLPNIKNENDDDFRMFLITALATGKLSPMEENSKPQQVAFHHLLKRVFATPKALLDLQDESVPMDVQVKALERLTAYAVRRGTQGKNGIVKGLPNRKISERNRCEETINEPTTVRTHEDDSSVFGEATTSTSSLPPVISENTGIGVDLPIPLEEAGELIESFLFPHFQSLIHLMIRSANDIIQVERSTTYPLEEEEASSSENNIDPSEDEMANEIQVVTVTPCGSLLALLTTKGRLLVYTMRNPTKSTQGNGNEHIQGSFCEKIILDTKFTKDKKEPRWYEHLASFLRFSPCGRFLLCSVQNNVSSFRKEEETNRVTSEYTGKVFIYSMHCTDTKKNDSSREFNNDEDRLYADFRIHTAPIVVATWMDPRFWGRKISKTSIRSLDENSPDWKREAYKHLSVLQCLSCGTENVILRWSPADGSLIQKIATIPLHDILVSPLMQAIYTTDQKGQLSMYDAWNEHNIGFATGNSVVVSHRGLPASLSMMRSSAEAREGGSLPKSTTPLTDGDMQHDYFVGTRIIRFDRRRVTQCGAKCEPMATEISKVMQEKGLPAGMETRDSSRLGRHILQQVLGEEETRFIPCTQAMLDPSSGSDNEDSNQDRVDGNHSYRNQSDTYRDVEACINPIPFLRSQQMHSGKNESTSVSNDNVIINDDSSFTGRAIFYKTGSRLVFDEVSQMLCQTACLWPPVPDPQYAAPQQPWNLLSMSVSGQPVWNEDDENSLLCHHCRFKDRTKGDKSSSLPFCNYYTDAKKEKKSRGYKTAINNNMNGAGFSGVGSARRSYSTVCTCRRSAKRVVLSPTASNGRYLCIMASVGPSRVALHRNRPLEYHAGMYACVVFDVLYGSVVRVIPVCSTLPHSSLLEDMHTHPHSNIRRVPIFMLPCSVAVVRRPRRRQQKQRSASTSRGGKSNRNSQIYGSFMPYLDQEDEELEEQDDEDEDDYEDNNNDSMNDVNLEGDDAMVVVAVGALHSRTYTFNALTGSRIKVIDLRKRNEAQNRCASAEARPPSKRARHPYLSLAKPGVFDHQHFLDEDDINDDDEDTRNEEDSDISSSSIERQSLESREQYESERHALLRQLADKHGMSTLLRATVDLLRVVPFPFYQFDKLRGDETRRAREKQLSCSRQRSLGGTHIGASNSLSMPLSLHASPSFLGQLRFCSGVFDGSDVTSMGNRRSKDEGTIANEIRLHNIPFELVSYRTLRRLMMTGVAVSGQEMKGETTEVTQTQPTRTEGVNAPPPFAAAVSSRDRTYFRCGVVNSVALWCDKENGGVYVFSSDEYGGLFVTGGLIELAE